MLRAGKNTTQPDERVGRGSSWSVGFEPYYHQQDGPAGQFPSERDAAWDRLAATTGSMLRSYRRGRGQWAPERGIWAMLVATTRLRASECRAEDRAIAVAFNDHRVPAMVCGRPTGPTDQEV
jgi:hypothetical protein